MRKRWRLLCLLLALLLTGCSLGELSAYPYVSQEKDIPHVRLTLAVSQEEWLVALGGQLSEVVADLSNEAVTLEIMPQDDPLSAYREGTADLVFCSTAELRQADASLEWLTRPFLFDSPQKYLAALNSPTGPLSSLPALRENLNAEVIGAYYDCGWMLALRPGVSREALLAGQRIGTDIRFAKDDIFSFLGAKENATANTQRLWQLLQQGEIGTMEFRSEEADTLSGAGGVILSRHRIEGQFLLMREGAAAGDALLCLRQAISETVEQACSQRMEWEDSRMNTLALSYSAEVIGELPDAITLAANDWYGGRGSKTFSGALPQSLRPYLR